MPSVDMWSFAAFSRAAALLLLASYLALGEGHGLMTYPRQRGALKTERNVPNKVMDASVTNIDYCPHCNNCGGVGSVSANENGWKMFEPFERKRTGISLCGDPVKGQQNHMRTGMFANPPSMPHVANFKPGGVANFEYDFTTNHNGYLAFYLCDVSSTGDVKNDVGYFKQHCYELERSPHPSCESGRDRECGPIDPRYPGRFVIPCRTNEADQVVGGPNGKMAYKIPNVVLKDAVIISYWLAQNTCSTPDNFMQEYKYPQAWNGCPGDGGSIGGKPNFEDCITGNRTPEEFFNCADVTIMGGAGGGGAQTGPLQGSEPTEQNVASPPGGHVEKPNGGGKPMGGSSEPGYQPADTGHTEGGTGSMGGDEDGDCDHSEPEVVDPTEVVPDNASCSPHYRQCGGKGFNGPTSCCDSSWTCVQLNPYYHQCLSTRPPGLNGRKY